MEILFKQFHRHSIMNKNCRKETPLFQRYSPLTAVIFLFQISACVVANNDFSKETFQPISTGCPVEYYHGIRVEDPKTGIEKGQTSAVGERVVLKCSSDPFNFTTSDLENFVVFPRDKLACQPDGTWFKVPPICVDRDQMMLSRTRLTLASAVNCNRSDCDQWLKNWKKIGKFRTNLEHNAGALNISDKYEVQDVLISFHSKAYLSALFFQVPVNSNGDKIMDFNVEIYADPRDQYGDESMHFPLLEEHYSSLKENYLQGFNAVSHITAYTKTVIVRFISKKDGNYDVDYDPEEYKFQWGEPKPIFYHIVEYRRRKRNDSGRNHKKKIAKPKCPATPIIPNANVTYSDENIFIYECIEGYEVIDLMTGRSQPNASITCIHNGRYEPYPFPVCVKRLSNISNELPNQYDSSEEESYYGVTSLTTYDEVIDYTVAEVVKVGSRASHSPDMPASSTLATVISKDTQNAIKTYHDQQKKENAHPQPSIPKSEDGFPGNYGFDSSPPREGDIAVSKSTINEERAKGPIQFDVTFAVAAIISLFTLGAISSCAIAVICVKYRRREWKKRYAVPAPTCSLCNAIACFNHSSGMSSSSSCSFHEYDYPVFVSIPQHT